MNEWLLNLLKALGFTVDDTKKAEVERAAKELDDKMKSPTPPKEPTPPAEGGGSKEVQELKQIVMAQSEQINNLTKIIGEQANKSKAAEEAAAAQAKKEFDKQVADKVADLLSSGRIKEGEKEEATANLGKDFDGYSKTYDRLPPDPAVNKGKAGNNGKGSTKEGGGEDKPTVSKSSFVRAANPDAVKYVNSVLDEA